MILELPLFFLRFLRSPNIARDDNQNVSHEAAVTHLHLVCFAYALLTHVAIRREGAQGKRKAPVHLSSSDLQNAVRRIVWDDLTDYLKQFSSGTQIVKELKRLLIAT